MGLEVLSKETLEYANRRIEKAAEKGQKMTFRRIGSDKMYMNAKPPAPRIMAKKYTSLFTIRDEYDLTQMKNKSIHYTQGVETVQNGTVVADRPRQARFESDDSGFIIVDVSDRLLCTLLLLDDRNADYKHRNKGVQAEWYEVKPVFTASGNFDLLRERTEHDLIGLIFGMDKEELEAYAFEVKEKGGNITVADKNKQELAKELIDVIKRDPLLFGQCIPSKESRAKVLIMQGINMDLIKATKNGDWNFVKRNLAEENGFAQFGVTATVPVKEQKLVEFLVSKEGTKIHKKLQNLLFPSDDEDWAFLEAKEEAVKEAA